ncbi:peptide deformylase [Cytobacillus purgationiresistens]|uniref:Peptide deformylase n=1 Tax=Cytobacillus purgationiresistens TaxID=863449 RepID=A0ABU0AP21_9BACI|nr:peptide deformylase [Cytobacillus purgationiresistens]MDQ0271805.1 peptide deformylase [Cytobacillus purgationiresistens]
MNNFQKDYIVTMKDFVPENHEILHTKLDDMTLPFTEQDQIDLECMMAYLRNSQDPEIARKYKLRAGTGLSANQIGIAKRMFAARYEDEKGEVYEYKLINPKIYSHSTNIICLPEGEGCLSVNREIFGQVPRYEKIKVKAYNEEGEQIILSFKGYGSILMQHEIDHLNGIMFYERIDKNNPIINKI